MLTTALRHADDVSSDHIKWALHDELLRIPAHGRRGTLEKEASALVDGVKGRDALSHSGRDSATPSEGIPATGGVGGYLSREQEAPFTDQLSTSPRPQVDLSTSLASRTRKRGDEKSRIISTGQRTHLKRTSSQRRTRSLARLRFQAMSFRRSRKPSTDASSRG